MKRVKLMKNNKEYAMNSKGDTGDKGDKGDIGAGAYETYKSIEGNENKTKEEFLSELLYNDYKSIEGNEDKTKEEILYDLGYQCYLSIEGNENKTKEDFIEYMSNKKTYKKTTLWEGNAPLSSQNISYELIDSIENYDVIRVYAYLGANNHMDIDVNDLQQIGTTWHTMSNYLSSSYNAFAVFRFTKPNIFFAANSQSVGWDNCRFYKVVGINY